MDTTYIQYGLPAAVIIFLLYVGFSSKDEHEIKQKPKRESVIPKHPYTYMENLDSMRIDEIERYILLFEDMRSIYRDSKTAHKSYYQRIGELEYHNSERFKLGLEPLMDFWFVEAIGILKSKREEILSYQADSIMNAINAGLANKLNHK